MAKTELTTIYTRDDFLNSSVPFEEVFAYINDRFDLERELEKMTDKAKSVGIKNFKRMFKSYCEKIKKVSNQFYVENLSHFDGQELELITGSWIAADDGVYMQGRYGETIACFHPIMPVRRLVNVDSGIEKIEIAFKKSYRWQKNIFDKKQVASANTIVGALAEYGVSVTSENARHLVQYLQDVENYNYDHIPENKSVSRLGWIGEDGFSPYVDSLIFDGDSSFKHYFESVKQKGSYGKWLEAVNEIRKSGNVPAKILLAASFASVLVEPCGGLPFFVHLWGPTGCGKTVSLKLAASVWADPEMGRYIHTFNSTAVAQELSAGFVNSLPLLLDELQVVKDKKDFDQIIYQLSEGVGRSRGQKTGGLQRTTTWHNCIITTGEQPISSGHSGGGALNRIIEINCEDVKLFNEPGKLVDVLKKNYGHAGKKFVEELMKPEKLELTKMVQEGMYQELIQTDITEKQALAASLILTADTFANVELFGDDNNGLTVEEVSAFLFTHADVSADFRAYDWLKEWLAQNGSKFNHLDNRSSEVWGEDQLDTVYIIRNVFNQACIENGFNPQSFLDWLRRTGKIEVGEKGFTKSRRVNGTLCNVVVLRQLDDSTDEPLCNPPK